MDCPGLMSYLCVVCEDSLSEPFASAKKFYNEIVLRGLQPVRYEFDPRRRKFTRDEMDLAGSLDITLDSEDVELDWRLVGSL